MYAQTVYCIFNIFCLFTLFKIEFIVTNGNYSCGWNSKFLPSYTYIFHWGIILLHSSVLFIYIT